MYCIVPISD